MGNNKVEKSERRYLFKANIVLLTISHFSCFVTIKKNGDG